MWGRGNTETQKRIAKRKTGYFRFGKFLGKEYPEINVESGDEYGEKVAYINNKKAETFSDYEIEELITRAIEKEIKRKKLSKVV